MKLIAILSQHRSDFTGTLKCEHCEHEQKLSTGYDDHNYHANVIPKLTCNSCGKDREGEAAEQKSQEIKYRFYISDPYWGGMTGTNDEQKAMAAANDESMFVVDVVKAVQLKPDNGLASDVPEATSYESDAKTYE